MMPMLMAVLPTVSAWVAAPMGRHFPTDHSLAAAPWPRMPPCTLADTFVIERLSSIKSHFNELTAQLEDPEVMADIDKLLKFTKERARLEETVESFDRYTSLDQQLTEAKEMFAEVDDAEMREMAREEIRDLEGEISELDEKLKLLLLPTDPNDEKNVMVEIRAGTGGDEAAIWANDLLKLYTKYSDSQGWTTRVVSLSESEAGGCRDATIEIKGDAVYSKLKFEAGVHRVQRVCAPRPPSPSLPRPTTHTMTSFLPITSLGTESSAESPRAHPVPDPHFHSPPADPFRPLPTSSNPSHPHPSPSMPVPVPGACD